MIKCKNVAKSFDDKAVLKGISFDITEGQIFGLLGPSGAGKTTLIKILTGQLSFDGGEVITLDKEIEKLTGEDKRKIGIMMDQFGVYERLSCSDNLKIYADIYGIQYSKIKEILQYVGLGGAKNVRHPNCQKAWRQDLDLQEFLCIVRN